ncbi:DUF72 domain-containing protein [Verrucomicrobium spinosum]|nr:DUF72 domain-containing protein [Verrucomicrobium spinosum]
MIAGNTWIGTSGFQYPEWKGKFYPEDLSKAKMLTYYASQFNSTEINYTFRSIPSANTILRWFNETPANFRYSLKAPQRVTHFSKLKDCGDTMEDFFHSVGGLGDKLGPVLFQLPPTFKVDAERLKTFLATVSPAKKPVRSKSTPAGRRLAFEFRHDSWFTDDVYGILSEHNAALCLADSEEFETPRVATASFGYLRPRREDYKPSQIKQCAEFTQEQLQANTWSEAYTYFKHEENCVGPEFAKTLQKHLPTPPPA